MPKNGCESGSRGIEKVKSELTSPDRKGGGMLRCVYIEPKCQNSQESRFLDFDDEAFYSSD